MHTKNVEEFIVKKKKWSKFLAAILSICLLAASAPAALAQTAELKPLSAAPVAASGEEVPEEKYSKYTILKNGNFEEGTAGWSKVGQGFSFETSQTDAPEGDSAAVLTTTGAAGFIIQQAQLKSSSEFTLTFQVKGAAGTKGMIKIELAGANGILTSVPAPVLEFTTTGEGWEKKTLTFQTTEETTRANLLVRLLSSEGTISYDDIYLDGPLTEEQQKEADKMEGDGDPAPEDKYKKYTILKNGNFEGGTVSWNASKEIAFDVVAGESAEGEKAAEVTASGKGGFITQQPKLKAGSEFTLTLQVKGEAGMNGAIKVEQADLAGLIGVDHTWNFTTSGNGWEKLTYTFQTDSKTTRANLLLRVTSTEGTIYFDDVYLDGPLTDEQQKEADKMEAGEGADQEKEPVEGAADVMLNGGYELLDQEGNPEGLQCFGSWGDYAQVVQDAPHGGENCMRISTTEPKYPWVRHTIRDLMPGAQYQLTFWYKSDNDNFAVKFEFYGDQDTANPFYNQAQTPYYSRADEWTKATYIVTVPRRADEMQIYMRNFAGAGTVWVDDLSLYMVEKPAAVDHISTDRVFYYDEVPSGNAGISLSEAYDQSLYTVDFALMDGETVLDSAAGLTFHGHSASWNYSVASLEKKKTYTIRATVRDSSGGAQILEQNIYRFDRPSNIDSQGRCVVDGRYANPQILYHIYESDDVKIAAENGITVIQGALHSTPEAMLAYLDEMQALGMKVAIPFYYNMKPAGHPDNVETVKKIVQAVKDHPAVFGYMIQDEPFAHDYDENDIKKWLEDSYREIHLIDSKHPITICECFGNYYTESAKYCDMLIIDPYPGKINDYLTHVGNMGAKAVQDVPDNKPVLNLLQTFTFNYSAPEVGVVRHMAYQAYLAGQRYIGFYPWKSEGQVDPGNFDNLSQSPWWPEIVSFNQNERDILFEHFVTEKNPTFNRYCDDDIQYESWRDGDKIYIALLNRTTQAKRASVFLQGPDGKRVLSATAQIVAGGSMKPVISNGRLELELSGSDCLLLCVTPESWSQNTKPDFGEDSLPGASQDSEGGKTNPSTGAVAS